MAQQWSYPLQSDTVDIIKGAQLCAVDIKHTPYTVAGKKGYDNFRTAQR